MVETIQNEPPKPHPSFCDSSIDRGKPLGEWFNLKMITPLRCGEKNSKVVGFSRLTYEKIVQV